MSCLGSRTLPDDVRMPTLACRELRALAGAAARCVLVFLRGPASGFPGDEGNIYETGRVPAQAVLTKVAVAHSSRSMRSALQRLKQITSMTAQKQPHVHSPDRRAATRRTPRQVGGGGGELFQLLDVQRATIAMQVVAQRAKGADRIRTDA